jgi:hypothetical protein
LFEEGDRDVTATDLSFAPVAIKSPSRSIEKMPEPWMLGAEKICGGGEGG